jgi:hypothetical protein
VPRRMAISAISPKPTWMRWRIYDRKLEEIYAAEEVVEFCLVAALDKIKRGVRR